MEEKLNGVKGEMKRIKDILKKGSIDMKNELIEKLYYAACDLNELQNPAAAKRLSETYEVFDRKMAELKSVVPAAIITDLDEVCSEREELYGQAMFLLGLKSAVSLLQDMTDSEPCKSTDEEAKKHLKLSNIALQATIMLPGKNIVWSDLMQAIDSCDLSHCSKQEADEKSYILPALPTSEYIALCKLLNLGALGERIKPDNDLLRLKKHIFTATTALQDEALKAAGEKPFVLKMQAVPVIAITN